MKMWFGKMFEVILARERVIYKDCDYSTSNYILSSLPIFSTTQDLEIHPKKNEMTQIIDHSYL